jgi:hypothetical protein
MNDGHRLVVRRRGSISIVATGGSKVSNVSVGGVEAVPTRRTHALAIAAAVATTVAAIVHHFL